VVVKVGVTRVMRKGLTDYVLNLNVQMSK